MGERGGIVDETVDLYDQAFVVLAMAWWYRASGDAQALALARETLATIRRDFARPDGLGYRSARPDPGGALQNPHMHLFEAVLALDAIAPDAASRAEAERLRALFDAVLFDVESGTLGERFDDGWRPAAGEAGQIVEPGHHFEWVWLLHRAEVAGLGPAEPAASALFDFAERYGVVPGTALIRDAVGRDGRLLDPDHRSWPQTERLKALVARGEAAGIWDTAAIRSALDALWTHYIAPAPAGGWIDHIRADHAPRVAAIPASTLYHLFLAHAELSRVAAQALGAGPTGGTP